MMSSPYLRPTLAATRDNILEPLAVVEQWFAPLRLEAGQLSPQDAYNRMAAWAKIRRVREKLINETNHLRLWEAVSQQIESSNTHLIQSALPVPDMRAWLNQANLLLQDDESPATSEQETEAVIELLSKLDDADCFVWAAAKAGQQSRALRDDLTDCKRWLETNPECFLPASVYIQSVAAALEPNLPGIDFDLAMTADKYVILLDALEEAETFFSVDEAQPFPKGALEAAMNMLGSNWDWLPLDLIAAAGKNSMFVPAQRSWHDPAGTHSAWTLGIPGSNEVRLNFLSRSKAAIELAGTGVTLAGVPGTINSQGDAVFQRRDLSDAAQAGKPPVLEVAGKSWDGPFEE